MPCSSRGLPGTRCAPKDAERSLAYRKTLRKVAFFSKYHGEEDRGNRDERRVYRREAVHMSGLGVLWEGWLERVGRLGGLS